MRADLFNRHEHTLDLRWEHIDPLDFEHIVASAHHLVHPRHRTPAGTRFFVHPGQIAGAVPQQRHCLFGQGGDDQLTGLPFRFCFKGIRVNDFGKEMILRDM